ncbi:dihydrofolate reductase family protein [Amycolatopsis sp. QT-25]|uniref:dihydrofolate reductase family protein n=1 Tax=Amycolatopsis sp. QT-25 TaxID=3034022 RepID=UPI0023ECDF7B|nr:dihydrofolate reductase family protein [Amycolatopsis sp. QT-25]WET76180.1 dihydrofolate reductase family protein [Amycolatopsis sp. QT-25]
MRKIVAGLAISLDGVIDSPPNWMMSNAEMEEVIQTGIAESDAILLGRNTYVEFARMWPGMGETFPMAAFMNNTPKYVVSSTLTSLDWSGSTLLGADLTDELAKLKALPGKNIKIPGSPQLVRSLVLAGLLDELSLMIHPIVLGSGARLFEAKSERADLELVASKTFENGVISVTYRPKQA